MAERIEIRAQPGAQEAFLATSADIAIYGGAAGGGKSFALLLEPLRHIRNPQFGAVVFRRTYSEVTNEGGLWDESANLYPQLGGVPNLTELSWAFPGGMAVRFAHLQYEKNVFNYQGAQIALLGFDELTHFTEGMFFYLLSRNRSMSGVPGYVRATCNPDPDSWVAKFIAWWLCEDGYANMERAGKLRYFYRVNEQLTWGDSAAELMDRHPKLAAIAPPKSVTFIPATVYDNQILLNKDPGYLANLLALPLVEQERLLGDRTRGGNWLIRPAAGKVFNRSWFEIVDAAPAGGADCRCWDFAASVQKLKGDDPDYTAGVKLRTKDGVFYVLDMIEERLSEIDELVKNTAAQDLATAQVQGANYLVRWEIEPGSASIRENTRLVALLTGHDAMGIKSTGDKLTRARGLAAQAKAGNVKLVRGAWNDAWLRHMHGQPDLPHDDVMDASAGAFNALNIGVSFGYSIA